MFRVLRSPKFLGLRRNLNAAQLFLITLTLGMSMNFTYKVLVASLAKRLETKHLSNICYGLDFWAK